MAIIILDRDGVINYDSDAYIKSPEEWTAIPGSLESIARLNQAGYRVVVVTNQSGLARKLFNIEALHMIHQKILTHLAQYGGTIEAFFFCPHAAADKCECRKPKTGLYKMIQERLYVSLAQVPCVGDKATDIEAAISVDAQPIWVKTGIEQPDVDRFTDNVLVFDNLAMVADHLLLTR